MSVSPGLLAFSLVLGVALLCHCGGASVPDPKTTWARFAVAAEHGDADALYSMLSKEAKANIDSAAFRALVQSEREELGSRARGFANEKQEVVAELRFEDGETASLRAEGGTFRVSNAGSLPGGSTTPEGALAEFRRALLRRNYRALLRILSPETRRAVEQDLESLGKGLEHIDTVPISIRKEFAEANIAGGHSVRLRKDASGKWRIENFD